ncbi:tyrosine-type recombinase/integrase [Neisseria sp.]|uniref:tyrosine-type recombinase/integrase n=1 Tax=Neisseria sp. TaxID=192066 RepID=UPI0035A01716
MTAAEFSAYAEAYLSALRQQGKSPHTLAAYRRDLVQLFTLMPSENTAVSRSILLAALKRLSQQGAGERSIARKLSVWRQYCGWLLAQNLSDTDPTLGLKAPKAPERLPKAVEQETLNRVLDSGAADMENVLDVRDQAVFELMYGSGLRLGEVQALNLHDILLDEGWVSVVGKGGKHRQVPLAGKSIEAVRAYLAERTAVPDETALFTNRFGKRLSRRQIQSRLQQWALKHGSPQHLSPHMMRHSYASHLLQSARDIRAVQELLGHSNLSTTQIYTKLDFDHLAKVYDETHPRAKRKK